MFIDAEKKILFLSRTIALTRDLTGHLSRAYEHNYGREIEDRLDQLMRSLDEAVIQCDQLRDQFALEMVELPADDGMDAPK